MGRGEGEEGELAEFVGLGFGERGEGGVGLVVEVSFLVFVLSNCRYWGSCSYMCSRPMSPMRIFLVV